MAASPQQRDPDVVAYEAFAGVRNDVAAERLGPSDLYIGQNVDLDNSGRVARRGGRTRLSATATHSLWADGGVLGLCVQGTDLKKLALDYALTVVRSGLTAGLPMSYSKVNDSVYFTNGRENGVLENGVARSWGLPVPVLPAVTVGAGLLPAGVYQYVTTYVRNDGQESGAGLAGLVTVPANGALLFTLTPSSNSQIVDSTLAYRNIYISPPNGDVLYHALQVAASATAATYANNALELTYELKTQFLSPPPAGHLAGYYSGRMYVAVDDALYPSEPFAYELFDLRNYIPMNGRCTLIAPMEDKERIPGGGGMNSGFFLGTDRNCGILVGNSPEAFQYVPKTDYGAIEGALDYVDGTLFGDGSTGARRLPMWLTTQGICIGMPDMEIRNTTRNRYSFTAAGRGAAVFQPNPNRFIAVSNF